MLQSEQFVEVMVDFGQSERTVSLLVLELDGLFAEKKLHLRLVT